MKLMRTRSVLEETENIGSKIPQGTNLFSGAVAPGYVQTVFYAEMEENVKSMVADVIQGSGDDAIVPFLTKNPNAKIYRSRLKEPRDTPGGFGDDKKEKFNSCQDDGDKRKYGNILSGCHSVAHAGNNLTVSWSEVKDIASVG